MEGLKSFVFLCLMALAVWAECIYAPWKSTVPGTVPIQFIVIRNVVAPVFAMYSLHLYWGTTLYAWCKTFGMPGHISNVVLDTFCRTTT
jgi:hypothetical protein